MKNNQHGYMGAALFLAAASIGTVTIAVQQKQASLNQQIEVMEKKREREKIKVAALNSAARYKGLLYERKNELGVYLPGIYAVDYFAHVWTIKRNPTLLTAAFTVEDGQVKMKSDASTQAELERSNLVFAHDAAIQSSDQEEFGLRIVDIMRATAGNGMGIAVESIDVEVFMNHNKKNGQRDERVRVRIPVPTPTPYDGKILFRRAGTSDPFLELTSGSQLVGTDYEFGAQFSGIAIGAHIIIDGKEEKLGYTSYNDIKHDARSYDDKNTVMPDTIKETFSSNLVFDDSPGVCKAIALNGSHSIQLKILAVDGTTVDYPLITFTPQEVVNAGSALSVADYENLCAAPGQCPYVGGEADANGFVSASPLGYYWADLHQRGEIDDIAGFWNYDQAQKMNILDQKLCTRIDPYEASLVAANDWMKTTTFVTYSPTTCKSTILTKRGACGCVAEDTLITLGDGKTQKRIDELAENDLIWNPITLKAMKMRRLTRGPEAIPMLRISVDGKELSVTGKHPFPTRSGMKTAFTLSDGEEIMLEGGKWLKIAKIAAVAPTAKPPVVWNIELDSPNDNWDAHHYVANGVVTGDLLIQIQLENEKRQASN